MMMGSSRWARMSSGTGLGIMPVKVAPPGSRAFTVTPVPSRSWDQITVSDSRAALEGP